jgi:hypothetical protein
LIVAPLVGSAIADAGIDKPFNAVHCAATVGVVAGVPPVALLPLPLLPPHALIEMLRASAHPNVLLVIVVSGFDWLVLQLRVEAGCLFERPARLRRREVYKLRVVAE